ncbi:MASE3 domain-containing protein [Clostridium sp.]|uniref:MASE3 domain-containing protein n=1 Tax=Clostridium sp. TaxID=1506 RepID=UPI0028508F2C|nr:MASE3 domain-containing protein [Clostridium sp.]MDR3598334.1 MASE3 domain-containing protein [Clostridium sp.]
MVCATGVNKNYKEVYMNITIKFIYTLVKALLVSIFIWILLWNNDRELIHSILNSGSMCIGIAIFLIIWNKREDANNFNHILGYGFLMVSIFDFMHTFYYKYFIAEYMLKGELAVRFWILARLIEVSILMIFSLAPYAKNPKRSIMMIGAIVVTCGLIFIVYTAPNIQGLHYDPYGIDVIKAILEYLVIIIAIFVLFRFSSNLQKENIIKFKYLFLSTLLIIPSQICFVTFNDSNSFFSVFGHVLKITSYFYLYKGVFKSLINYPYDKLGENNQRLHDILNAIPISVQTFNINNEVDFVNRKFEELFKCSKETVLGAKCSEMPNLLHEVDNNSENILTANARNIIRSYLNSEGKEIKTLINVSKIKGGNLVLANDVKQEQEIRNLNLQAQTILNAITVPTVIFDVDGNVAACNSSYTNLVEIDYNDIVNMNICELYAVLKFSSKENVEKFEKYYLKNQVEDCSIETPKGNIKQLRITRSTITNIYNEVIGVVSVLEDISKRKKEQLKLINQEKLALLGQMGATIVHETRNFLTTIKGNSQLIELHVKDEKIKKYARKINADTTEINRIISDFLCLSKPRETEMEEVAFNDLVSSMKNTIETSSLIKNVELISHLDYVERYILCDETQIKQVILNICKNAIEAMEEVQNPVLCISTGLDEDRKEVFMSISDNGKGMDNETIKKIGTPFFTTKKTGTGLGINACYQIIKEHKGRIQIQSDIGKGTQFTVIIPYIDEDIEDIV